MALLDLKTNLKSLKYGSDTPGGGNSGQPYQQVDINTADSGFNQFRMTKFDDGLVRGGVVGAANASIVDTFRIGKFLKDFPKGPLFIVKQVGLQLSNPQIEHKTDFPTNRPTREQGLLRNVGNFISNTANKILNTVGPTRIYNLGINTLAQVPVNAFGQHIVRHGFTPRRDNENLYFKVAEHNNNEGNNRLIQLKSIIGNEKDIANYIGGPSSIYGIGNTTIRRRGDFININQDVTANPWASFLTFYSSPNSFANSNAKAGQSLVNEERQAFTYIDPSTFNGAVASGMGTRNKFSEWNRTKYIGGREYALRNDIDYIEVDPNIAARAIGQVSSINDTSKENTIDKWRGALTASNDFGVSNQYFSGSEISLPKNLATYGKTARVNGVILQDNNSFSFGAVPQYNTLSNDASYKTYQRLIASKQLREKTYTFNNQQVNTFGIYGDPAVDGGRGNPKDGILPSLFGTPTYTNGTKVIQINKFWREASREVRVGSGVQDQINLTPLFENTTGTMGDDVTIGGKKYNINDLVKFRIQSLNYDNPSLGKWMVFRAYLTQFSDSVNAQWGEIQYAGRGDKFYVYNGFTRSVNIGFKVGALSAEEMQPMYQKLNYLMGNLMGEYYNNVMRGTLVKMTVGNWFDGQDGILNSLSYTVPQESPWEIGLKVNNGIEPLILPHIVEVSMTFTPIGSQTKGVNKISEKNSETSHFAQNYNKETQYATKFSKVG
jgi:hypothetical protein